MGWAACQVEWEEKWWDVSDWAGMKEMGAEKSGCRADGAAWRETWREAISYDQQNGEPMVERSAHKWACDAKVRETRVLLCLFSHTNEQTPGRLASQETCQESHLLRIAEQRGHGGAHSPQMGTRCQGTKNRGSASSL